MAYQTINKIFQKNDSDLSSSEAHGLATGMLCIEIQAESANWLAELFENDVILTDEDKTILDALFEQTRLLLKDEDQGFRYDLFLPGDDEDFSEQLRALSVWCEGFLFGIGYTQSSADWPSDVAEIMKDIVEFTKLDSELDEDLNQEEIEEQEAALIEIQEYLRAAVMLVKDQFMTQNNANGQSH